MACNVLHKKRSALLYQPHQPQKHPNNTTTTPTTPTTPPTTTKPQAQNKKHGEEKHATNANEQNATAKTPATKTNQTPPLKHPQQQQQQKHTKQSLISPPNLRLHKFQGNCKYPGEKKNGKHEKNLQNRPRQGMRSQLIVPSKSTPSPRFSKWQPNWLSQVVFFKVEPPGKNWLVVCLFVCLCRCVFPSSFYQNDKPTTKCQLKSIQQKSLFHLSDAFPSNFLKDFAAF